MARQHKRRRNRPRTRSRKIPKAVLEGLLSSSVGKYLSKAAQEKYVGLNSIKVSPMGQAVEDVAQADLWRPTKASVAYAKLGFADYALLTAPELVVVRLTENPTSRAKLRALTSDTVDLQRMYREFKPDGHFKVALYSASDHTGTLEDFTK